MGFACLGYKDLCWRTGLQAGTWARSEQGPKVGRDVVRNPLGHLRGDDVDVIGRSNAKTHMTAYNSTAYNS
jgi:hypothetical protein